MYFDVDWLLDRCDSDVPFSYRLLQMFKDQASIHLAGLVEAVADEISDKMHFHAVSL